MSVLKLLPARDAPPRDLHEAAAWWLMRQRSPRWSRLQQRRLEAWLAEEPRHAEALEQAERAWRMAGMLAASPSVLALRERALGRILPDLLAHPVRAAAAAFCVAALGALLALSVSQLDLRALSWPGAPAEIERHQTAHGSRSTLRLADGTRVDLNSDTVLDVAFDRRSRVLRLERGEAWFDVAHDARRPFRVEAGGRTITDIGTAFNVRVDPEQIQVGVAHGKVGVGLPKASAFSSSAWMEVDAGQRLTAAANGALRLEDVDTASLGSWRLGRVQFANTPLREALTEMNRYGTTPVRLAEPSLGALRVSGVFFTDGRTDFLVAVTNLFDLQVRSTSNEIVLSRRTAASPPQEIASDEVRGQKLAASPQ